MDILEALHLAPSLELYRLYLTVGRMLDDPQRILECRRHLHIGMAISYVDENPTRPLRAGRILELRQTQAIVEDDTTRRRWALPYAAIVAGASTTTQPPPRAQRDDFQVGDTVAFTDQYLREHVGTIVRINQKTASIQCDSSDKYWRVSFSLLRNVVDL